MHTPQSKNYGARYVVYPERNRFGNPRISIFLSVDPLVEQTMSAYDYTYNNPINLADPTGMSVEYPIYGKDGTYLGDDGRSGEGDLAFTGTVTKRDENGNATEFDNLQQFTDNHTEFMNSSALIQAEISKVGNAESALWMAHSVNNARGKLTFNEKLKTGYSSLKDKSVSISTENNSNTAKYSRAGVIDVLLGGKDPTGGAKYWDGIDFFDLRSMNLNHPKFKQYSIVNISWDILINATNFWDNMDNRSLVNRSSAMNCMYYDRTSRGTEWYDYGWIMRSEWGIAMGSMSAARNSKVNSYITATGFKSGTIFWKEVKK